MAKVMAHMLSNKFFIHDFEEYAFNEMRKEIRFLKALKTHYEDYTAAASIPDLYGKTVKVSGKQFKDIHNIVKAITAYLEMPMPEIYVFESFYYTVEGKGTEKYQWIEMSAKAISELTADEITFLLAKELMAIKLLHTQYNTLINEFLEAVRNNVSFKGIKTATSVIKVIMYRWSRMAQYTTDNFAYLWSGDLKICFNAITKTVLNDIFLAENINIPEYIRQAERINSLTDNIHTFSKTNELVPYIPFRLKNLIAYASSSRGIDAKKEMPERS
jgi:hypothetical protein